MITVIHIDEQTAIETTRELIKANGPTHPLSQAWIAALYKNFRLRYVHGSDGIRFGKSV